MKVLDSTFLIDAIAGEKETLPLLSGKATLLTTQICMFEVIRGLFKKKASPLKIQEVMELFEHIRVLPFDDQAVVKSAEISAELWNRGNPIPDSDCMIAGSALSKKIPVLVTRNVKHFNRIQGLTVETY